MKPIGSLNSQGSMEGHLEQISGRKKVMDFTQQWKILQGPGTGD